MTTIMHSLEEDGSSSETEASDAEPAAGSRQHSAALPPMQSAAAAPAAGHITPGNGPTPYTGPHESPQLQVRTVTLAGPSCCTAHSVKVVPLLTLCMVGVRRSCMRMPCHL